MPGLRFGERLVVFVGIGLCAVFDWLKCRVTREKRDIGPSEPLTWPDGPVAQPPIRFGDRVLGTDGMWHVTDEGVKAAQGIRDLTWPGDLDQAEKMLVRQFRRLVPEDDRGSVAADLIVVLTSGMTTKQIMVFASMATRAQVDGQNMQDLLATGIDYTPALESWRRSTASWWRASISTWLDKLEDGRMSRHDVMDAVEAATRPDPERMRQQMQVRARQAGKTAAMGHGLHSAGCWCPPCASVVADAKEFTSSESSLSAKDLPWVARPGMESELNKYLAADKAETLGEYGDRMRAKFTPEYLKRIAEGLEPGRYDRATGEFFPPPGYDSPEGRRARNIQGGGF